MEASILDLRYKMNDVLKALERNEVVRIFYRGKLRGEIQPMPSQTKVVVKITEHPYFGMNKEASKTVEQMIEELRKGRYDDI